MKKLLTRTVSGIIYCGIIIGAVLCGGFTVMLLAVLLATLGTVEFSKINSSLSRERIPVLLLDIAGCIALALFPCIVTLPFWLLILMVRFIMELYLKEEHPVGSMATSILGQIYIGVPLGCMVAIYDWFATPHLLLALFFLIWINDTGAFVTGCTFGKHRLFERISPKKSWEGFFGGLIFSVAGAWIFCNCCSGYFGWQGDQLFWLLLAVVSTVFATWGDLTESLLKRSKGIKDSGNLIPGHGGILDRIDSLLFVAPAVLLYLLLF